MNHGEVKDCQNGHCNWPVL